MRKERYFDGLLDLLPGEGNRTCISIIVPLHKQLPERNKNKLAIKNAVNKATDILKNNFAHKDIDGLISKLDKLQASETFTAAAEGVGLYVNEDLSKAVYFPFKVKGKVIVDESFEVRDLIFVNNRMLSYYVLALSNNKTRFFKSRHLGIEEVENDTFPLTYEEQFQYPARQKPKISGSYGSEESTIQEERQRAFYRHLDKQLTPYFKDKPMPVILLGVADQQVIFKKNSRFHDKIAISINGNFDHLSSPEILKKIWPELTKLLEKKEDEVVDKLERLTAASKVIAGVKEVWDETSDMAGKTLVVEKDFRQAGYLDQKTGTLSLTHQKGEDWQKMQDLVDDIIELTIGRHGKVIFVENGKLKNFGKIALIKP